MAYQNYTVRIKFTKEGSGEVAYILPYVDHISDPKEGMKATVIEGNRGDGSIVIPGGKKSQQITVYGQLVDADGYKDITSKITEMKAEITTDLGVLEMEHYDGGWQTDWSYTVRRIDEIRFPSSLRTSNQKYEINFLVLAY